MLTASGKKASLAALAREHEYQDWLGLRCGDQECTWAAFMAERRASKERERKRKLGENRTAQRRAEQTKPTYLHRQDQFALSAVMALLRHVEQKASFSAEVRLLPWDSVALPSNRWSPVQWLPQQVTLPCRPILNLLCQCTLLVLSWQLSNQVHHRYCHRRHASWAVPVLVPPSVPVAPSLRARWHARKGYSGDSPQLAGGLF